MERQKHRASSLDDDDEEDSKEDDEDLTSLQSIPDVSLGSGGGAGPSDADSPAGARTEESFTRKRAASSPLRGSSPKHPYVTTTGGRDSSRVAPVNPSLLGPEALA